VKGVREMPVLALVLLGSFLLVGLGLQGWRQHRRTGCRVLRGLARRPFSTEWWIGEAVVLGFGSIALSAVLELLGVTGSVPALSGRPRVLGVALALAAFALVQWSVVVMGESWRVDVDEADRSPLVTRGPFRLVGNPVYSSMTVLAVGLALVVPSAISGAGVGLVIGGLELQVRVLEEPHLLRRHGEVWRENAATTGRFVSRHRRPPGVTRV
jgi:protein-S-isoprenylcysteine O-methyltransferase Ste14